MAKVNVPHVLHHARSRVATQNVRDAAMSLACPVQKRFVLQAALIAVARSLALHLAIGNHAQNDAANCWNVDTK